MSYDAKQLRAVLTRCQSCGQEYYMTQPIESCIKCKRVCPSSVAATTEQAS